MTNDCQEANLLACPADLRGNLALTLGCSCEKRRDIDGWD
jgi:hypothetical protein